MVHYDEYDRSMITPQRLELFYLSDIKPLGAKKIFSKAQVKRHLSVLAEHGFIKIEKISVRPTRIQITLLNKGDSRG